MGRDVPDGNRDLVSCTDVRQKADGQHELKRVIGPKLLLWGATLLQRSVGD